MSRREERETVFTLLYEYTFYDAATPADFLIEREELREGTFSDFVKESFTGVLAALGEIDKRISEYAKGWKLTRLSRVTKSILRLAVYELIFTDTPPKAVINEAVELAKKYDEQKASGFVNGILNKLARGEGKIAEAGESNANAEKQDKAETASEADRADNE